MLIKYKDQISWLVFGVKQVWNLDQHADYPDWGFTQDLLANPEAPTPSHPLRNPIIYLHLHQQGATSQKTTFLIVTAVDT
jgi:hypothetical protein